MNIVLLKFTKIILHLMVALDTPGIESKSILVLLLIKHIQRLVSKHSWSSMNSVNNLLSHLFCHLLTEKLIGVAALQIHVLELGVDGLGRQLLFRE